MMISALKGKTSLWIVTIVAFIFIAVTYFTFRGGVVIAAVNSSKTQEQCVEVVITKGDTLWDLARKYGNVKKDPRLIIFEIQELNGLNPLEHIQPGQILKIPTR